MSTALSRVSGETAVRDERALTSHDTPRAGVREWIALAVLMLPVLLVAVDNTVLSFALPSIAAALSPSGTGLLWIVDIYPLVLAALLVSMGSMADRIGRRRLLLIGSAGFAVVSALAAFAPTTGWLIAGRAALGFFGAMLMPSTLSLLRALFVHAEQRRLAIAIWAAGFAGGAALGPVVGGVLLEHFWWGSVFLMAVPVLLVLLVLAPIFVPESRDPNPSPIDPVSIGLSLATMAPLVFGIKTVAEHGVTDVALVSVGIGLAAGVTFVRRQLHRAQPMLDLRLFNSRVFSAAVLANLLSIFALVGFLFFVSQHLQLVLGLSPLQAGLTLLPGLVGSVAAGLAVVPLTRWISPRIIMAAGFALSAVAYGIVIVVADNPTAAGLTAAFVVLSAGIGAAETLSNDAVLTAAPPARAGAASAISETAYELGAVLGTAVLGSILTASYRSAVQLPAGLTAEQAAAAGETLGGASTVAAELPQGAAIQLMSTARQAFDTGVVTTSALGVVVALAASVLVLVAMRPQQARAQR
ncbi:MFS transporter [Nakamurella flavida]|uniref:MFS transporter n=1 Tax=Nakamurella flavida TaxID=363630 RepID=A0A938YEW8_9ACTN|nr:MFS transporter [Nakamurella flavida]MBM9476405.1 MFS transporter [Nakamurella flavida]MDP9779494.1 DHA2 family multidrug resistance protein-like MFS transporter [Nakamurella flavida]